VMVPDPNNRTVVECAIVRNGSELIRPIAPIG
jgi:hypothetical protein